MRANFVSVAALVLCGAACPALAQDDLKLHPIPGLYGTGAAACGPPTDDTLIAPALCDRLAPLERRQYWGARFSQLVQEVFGEDRIRSDLSATPPDGLSRETFLSQALVTSLHVSRADLWTVTRSRGVEVHMPITLSLLMTNIITGEVMFAHRSTTYVSGRKEANSYVEQARSEFDANFDAALVKLVQDASARFRPGAVTATVRGRVGENYVIDAGGQQGLREGDQFGDASVVYADNGYAIIRPELGSLSVGQKLVRYVAQPADALARPSLLVVPSGTTADFPAGYLTTLMEEALADTGGFSLVSVNPASATIRNGPLAEAQVAARPPALPDYFLRLTASPLDPLRAPSRVADVDRRVQAARVYLEVLDHSGRVVFATEGSDIIVDEIVDGMAPADKQRREAAVRNAMLRAAESLKSGFSPARTRLTVSSASGDQALAADPAGLLGRGSPARILRSAGRIAGLQSEIFYPVASAEVLERRGSDAVLRQSDVETRRLRRGDVIVLDNVGASARSDQTYAQCRGSDDRPVIDFRASPQPLFRSIAFNRFATAFRGAVHAPDFAAEASRLNLPSVSAAYAELGALKPFTPDVCFEPVHNISANGERASARGYSQPIHTLTIGYILKRNGERVGAAGLGQELTATAVPTDSSADYREASLQIDLATAAANLASRAATQLSSTPH